jgi:Flp pilus assembly pilin Flp
MKLFKNFFADESGAVTVDWVVLTAAIVGVGVAVLTTVSGGTTDLAGDVAGELSSMTILSH